MWDGEEDNRFKVLKKGGFDSHKVHYPFLLAYNGGIASLITTDGPEKNTIQWSPDGIDFEIMSVIKGAPHAIGLNRSLDTEGAPFGALGWGLTHQYKT